KNLVKHEKTEVGRWFDLTKANGEQYELKEVLTISENANGVQLYNGEPKENAKFYQVGQLSKNIVNGVEVDTTRPVGPFKFLNVIKNSDVVRFSQAKFVDGGEHVSVYYQNVISGKSFLLPGLKYKIGKGASIWSKLDFISLMLALFLGTAALPHIL